MSAFQFYVTVDGVSLDTKGFVQGYGSQSMAMVSSFWTPLGLMTVGLLIGRADFWRYGETYGNAGWTNVDLR